LRGGKLYGIAVETDDCATFAHQPRQRALIPSPRDADSLKGFPDAGVI
jgi:hypothetical protein